jgi:hypothetical protein
VGADDIILAMKPGAAIPKKAMLSKEEVYPQAMVIPE